MLNYFKKISYYILLTTIILSINSVEAQYTPFFQNYSLTEYKGGNQNWDISVAENGKVYVANDKGLAEFDGLKWSFYQLPNKTIIRSVLAHKDRIYTGSYEEFGYWQKNNKGVLIYTSLRNFGDKDNNSDEEFWDIVHVNGVIWFRSFSSLYSYSNNEVRKITDQPTIISCDAVDGKLYLSTLRRGIFTWNKNNLVPLLGTQELVDQKVMSISKFNDQLLITTALHGCYLYNGKNLTKWNPEINNIIKLQQLNGFLLLENGNMVFGTIKNGVYITDPKGNILFHLNKENGLLNNTVLNLELGLDQTVWVGLDNGLSQINLNNHNILYIDKSGNLGAVYDIINFNDTFYIGSNTGLYYLDNGNLVFIEGSQGQVWDLKEIDGELFCGHNNGTFLVKGNQLNKISNFTGGYVIKKAPQSENVYIQGTYAGLVKFFKSNGVWQANHLGGATIPIKYLVFEDPSTAWAAHAYKGLFRVKFDEDYDEASQIVNYVDKGLWSDYNVKVHNIKNDICFKTNKGWQKYEPLMDSIVPHQILNKSFGPNTNLISEPETNDLVLINKNGEISFVSKIGDKISLELPKNIIQKNIIVDKESVSPLNDSIYALNLYDGFMLINRNKEEIQKPLYKPNIEYLEINKELKSLNGNNKYQVPFKQSINISISSSKSVNHFFEYAIATQDTLIWNIMDTDRLDLSNLSNGKHQIKFRATNISGDVSQEETIYLEILPPWYKNSWFYLVIIAIIGLIFYALHIRKVQKEQILLHKKLVEKQRAFLKENAIKNEKKLVQIKNESLKNEIKLKSKQLANTAMALVKKNESMLEIKNEIVENKSGFKNSLAYKRLLRKIDSSIGHEDEWELFEYNFNQVHEEFFKQLKQRHPKLTHKDLKICAYIKMNLLSKEIAPLMNVSIRGLETHRYRLKRKLNLENDISLAEYLRNYQ